MSTIFALATPPGRGAIAIIRLSGPRTDEALSALGAGGLKPRLASLRDLTLDGRSLDQALVLRFPAPNSDTGEDCAELHLHGGRAVVEAVSNALIDLGLRPAEPGEFTRRAFENGRMDENIAAMQPDELMKTWTSFGLQAQDHFRRLMESATKS